MSRLILEVYGILVFSLIPERDKTGEEICLFFIEPAYGYIGVADIDRQKHTITFPLHYNGFYRDVNAKTFFIISIDKPRNF